MLLEKFVELTKVAIAKSSFEPVNAYYLEKTENPPTDDNINRVAGSPIGVTESDWPRYNNKKMHHLLTLDLNSAPELNKYFDSDVRAFSLFINDTIHHEAHLPGNSSTVVLHLKESDIENGVNHDVPAYDESFVEPVVCSFNVHSIELPTEMYYEYEDYDSIDPSVRNVMDNIPCAIAGGKPMWMQGERYNEDVLVQFDDFFIDMNLGDGGVMYVYKDTAFFHQ